jgi:hypothetical protein
MWFDKVILANHPVRCYWTGYSLIFFSVSGKPTDLGYTIKRHEIEPRLSFAIIFPKLIFRLPLPSRLNPYKSAFAFIDENSPKQIRPAVPLLIGNMEVGKSPKVGYATSYHQPLVQNGSRNKH